MRPLRESLESAKVYIVCRGSIIEPGCDRGWSVLEKIEVLEAREDENVETALVGGHSLYICNGLDGIVLRRRPVLASKSIILFTVLK